MRWAMTGTALAQAERRQFVADFIAPLFAARDRVLARLDRCHRSRRSGPVLIERRHATGVDTRIYGEHPGGMWAGMGLRCPGGRFS